MAKKLDTTYKSARYGSCTYALILDKRYPKKDRATFPVVMRYNGMMHGVKDEAGNLVGKISNTTRGIYLRSCRVVWN